MNQYHRLNSIKDMVNSDYEHIWDCCCDHGLLGIALLENKSEAKIHFIDQVEPIITSLTKKLKENYAEYSWQTYCLDLAQLKLPAVDESSNQEKPKHLLMIAGVGGDLLIELVSAILRNNPEQRIEFLLCPVRQNYWVREAMKREGLRLLGERLVRENGLFYEVLHLGMPGGIKEGKDISAVGSLMWDLEKPDHRLYLQRNIEHYRRSAQGDYETFAPIIQQYEALLDNGT